jgi:hypothetical protein
VEEKKCLRSKKDGDSKPHKDNPHHTNVKDKDQQKRKDQPKYDMKRDKRNDGLKRLSKRKRINKRGMKDSVPRRMKDSVLRRMLLMASRKN